MRDFIKLIPKNVKRIITTLEESGAEVYVVGGSVRNYFAGLEIADFDLTTNFTPDQVIESLSKVFNKNKIDTVGVSFGVVLVDGIEIASYRQDAYPEGNGASNAVVHYAKTIGEDVARRDLSINGLAVNLRGDLVDYHSGIEDLKNGVIRFIGNPVERINEDPCRILRALRFAAQFEATFDFETLHALRTNAHLVKIVAPERIQAEIFKVLKVNNPSIFFAALHTIGALDYVFPGMSKSVHHTHGNHHKENIWEHLMVVGDSISPRFPVVRLAGFLHDVGKPLVYNFEDGTFIGHEHVGASIVDKWLKRLKFSNDVRNTVVNLIRLHMIGAYGESSPKAIRKFRKTLADHNVSPQDWLRVRLADRKGNLNKHPFTLGQIRERREVFVDKFEPLPFTVNSLALKGGQLIELFNLTPGKVVGQLQKFLLNFVIDEGPEFNTPDVLKVEAEKFLNSL